MITSASARNDNCITRCEAVGRDVKNIGRCDRIGNNVNCIVGIFRVCYRKCRAGRGTVAGNFQ